MPHPVWSSDGAVPPLSGGLARDVLERLGVALDRPDLEGLGRLYGAWQARLGMENFSKRIALLEATDPTETARTPEATFEAFLRHGSSGTCWSTMEAFTALLKAAGFDARTYGGEMTGPGEMNHGTVVVVLDGQRYSVDQNLLWPAPLPLHPGEATQVEGPHYRAEARYEPERRGFRIRRLGGASEHRPTFLIDRELCREDYRQAWQRSYQRSIFNQGYFIIRIRGGSWRRLENTRYREMPAGGPLRESTPPAELPGFVAERFGLDAGLVARLLELERRAGIPPPSQGGLDAG